MPKGRPRAREKGNIDICPCATWTRVRFQVESETVTGKLFLLAAWRSPGPQVTGVSICTGVTSAARSFTPSHAQARENGLRGTYRARAL